MSTNENRRTVSEGTIADIHQYSHHSRPAYPKYANKQDRMDSLIGAGLINPLGLSEGGFFYTGVGDIVCCFDCGKNIRDWEFKGQSCCK